MFSRPYQSCFMFSRPYCSNPRCERKEQLGLKKLCFVAMDGRATTGICMCPYTVVCMYVSYVYMCVCVCVCECGCMYVCVCASACLYVIHTYTQAYIRIYTRMWIGYDVTCMYVCNTYMQTNIQTDRDTYHRFRGIRASKVSVC